MNKPQNQLGEAGGQPNNSDIVVQSPDQTIEPGRPPNDSVTVVQPPENNDMHKNKLTDYIIVQEIGDGHFSNTYSAVSLISNKIVCLKEQKDFIQEDKNEWNTDYFELEARLLLRFESPFIVKCHNKFYNNNKVVLELNLCQLGNLESLIERMKLKKD
ncbi:MAG: hypothetical protein EZS28_043297, partial [Streblomastix strix]